MGHELLSYDYTSHSGPDGCFPVSIFMEFFTGIIYLCQNNFGDEGAAAALFICTVRINTMEFILSILPMTETGDHSSVGAGIQTSSFTIALTTGPQVV